MDYWKQTAVNDVRWPQRLPQGILSCMRMALIANMNKPDAASAAQELADWIPRQVPDTQTRFFTVACAQNLVDFQPDIVVTLGGDGTILQAARVLLGQGVPVLGINFGKLGYLAGFSMEEFKTHIAAIVAKRMPLTSRLMIRGGIYRPCGGSPDHNNATSQAPLFEHVALNDIVINSGAPFRMIEIKVLIDGYHTTTFRGDGLIVSTPSGSTGYNLSANGPLLSPDVAAMVVTPICAHSLSFRPVVIADHALVRIEPVRVNEGTRVCFDGQVLEPLRPDHYVLIRRAEQSLKLVENPTLSHWQLLGNKLQWATSPGA